MSLRENGGGLGLFLIKQFVEDIQGEIYYEPGTIIAGKDASPCGAKFVCLLPLRLALMTDPYGEDRKSHYREWARSLADETVTA